jgi:hypothetical protein
MMEALGNAAPGSRVEAFSTSRVVFLMALQLEHYPFHQAIVCSVEENWKGQIRPLECRLQVVDDAVDDG